ncbi:F-box and leucine-rich repeat protein 16 [Fasciolopsis buskii]|uniref:F-box and leucine-rich repeat protein 16 n=1 Tax=Fasciolopsis buskii TaxID=27845 RepID=A0A8E0VJ50_9TREM|nr:F-box and leucine-rich repeat protein 16 [Fasciolopsis buski]
MTSFAKVCIDLSNNLRNLRFSKSPSSNSPISSSTNTLGVTNKNADLKSSNHRNSNINYAVTDPASGNSSVVDIKANGTKIPSPVMSPKSGHQKKQAPPVPSNLQTCEFESPIVSPSPQQATHPTRSENYSPSNYSYSCSGSAPGRTVAPPFHYNRSTEILPLGIDTRSMTPSTDIKRVPSFDRNHRTEIPANTINGSIPEKPISPNLTSRRFNYSGAGMVTSPGTGSCRSGEAISEISPRFSPRITFSPTMAQRVATLARSCQYNYTNSDASSVKSGASSSCSSPIMPHRGATVAAIKQRLLSQGLKIDLRVPARRYNSTRYRDYMRRVQRGRPVTVDALWEDEKVLKQIFSLLTGEELIRCCGVCQNWLRLIARLRCLDRAVITLNFKRLWTDSVREHNVKSPNKEPPGFNDNILFNENVPQAPNWFDPYLESKLLERLRAAVRRGIPILHVVQMADRYAPLLVKSILNVLYECDNPNGVHRKTFTNNNNLPASTLEGVQLRSVFEGTCNNGAAAQDVEGVGKLITKNEIRQPLTPVQSFMMSTVNSTYPEQPVPKDTLASDQVDNMQTPRYFSPLTTGPQMTADLPSRDNRTRFDCTNRGGLEDEEGSVNMRNTGSLGSPKHLFTTLRLQCCSVVDSTMEQLIRLLPGLRRLEIHCCNELSELAFWTCLAPSIVHLSVFDCINVSDESVGAITQMLPDLKRLTLQAYHVTDAAFSYFSPRQRDSLKSVRLTQCMDVTNQGLINLAFALPNLAVLGLNGCTNLTDDGLEVICENLKQLRTLDLAWCAKITDNVMECIASCLTLLEQLTLDR